MNKPTTVILVIGLSVAGVLGGLTLYDHMKGEYGSISANFIIQHKPSPPPLRLIQDNPLCTAGNPVCHQICGDHLCLPGETPYHPTK